MANSPCWRGPMWLNERETKMPRAAFLRQPKSEQVGGQFALRVRRRRMERRSFVDRTRFHGRLAVHRAAADGEKPSVGAFLLERRVDVLAALKVHFPRQIPVRGCSLARSPIQRGGRSRQDARRERSGSIRRRRSVRRHGGAPAGRGARRRRPIGEHERGQRRKRRPPAETRRGASRRSL